MKTLNQKKRAGRESLKALMLALMIITSGCGKKVVPIVQISDYCDRASLLSRKTTKKINLEAQKIRQESEARKETMDFFVNYYSQHEREFKQCPTSSQD